MKSRKKPGPSGLLKASPEGEGVHPSQNVNVTLNLANVIVRDNKVPWRDEVRIGTLVSLRICVIRDSRESFCSARSRKTFRFRLRWERQSAPAAVQASPHARADRRSERPPRCVITERVMGGDRANNGFRSQRFLSP
jgi:hypothetical protein